MTEQGRPMVPLEEALAIVERSLGGISVVGETLAVAEALGRTLVSDQVSGLDLPPFDKSAMDGYAVLAGDNRSEYRLLETVRAGEVPRARLEPGTTVKVMTGAAVPAGAAQVIRLEDTRRKGNVICVLKHGKLSNICPRAEDVRRGSVILKAGTAIGPLELANLVACGITRVEVSRRARIAILSTGDEIVDSPEQLVEGKIMNSNAPMLASLAWQFAMDVVAREWVPDDLAATTSAIRRALEAADIVVLSGGVSVGDFDYVGRALGEAGLAVHFTEVAVKPGRPMTYASEPGKAVFGLPGNPVSVYLMFHVFVLRAAAKMTGGVWPCREFTMPLGRDFHRRKADRAEYVPCRVGADGRLESVECHGSAHLAALTQADGFFLVPVGRADLGAGSAVRFMPVAKGWK